MFLPVHCTGEQAHAVLASDMEWTVSPSVVGVFTRST
jgi:metal-dependent hydrolase (beta-lactamase superfamily II)